jgi:osmoprotectant transport system permease protein
MKLLIVLVLAMALAQDAPRARPIVVASKPFGESYILCEMFAQLLEARGFRVDRRPGLGATEIAFTALRNGSIDVYPEYTGTGLLAILGDTTRRTPAQAFTHVASEFRRQFGVTWLPPLGFENTYAISVRRETATQYSLRTLTDLARVAPSLRAGFTADFIGRHDGLPGLARAYGLAFREVRPLLAAVKYQALASGGVDVIDGYSTDGLIARYDLVVLADDRGFFPPYQAAALVSAAVARDDPRAVAALAELSGRIDGATMRALNRELEVDGVSVGMVARGALDSLGLGSTSRATADAQRAPAGRMSAWDSFVHAIVNERAALARRTWRHLVLSAVSLVAAALVAIPFALVLERRRRLAEPLVRVTGLLQTIPGIALLAFMIPLLGIGIVPALVALFVYSLYPIVRNTYSGCARCGSRRGERGPRARDDAGPGAAAGAASTRGADDHGRRADGRGDQRRDGDPGGVHWCRWTWRANCHWTRALRHRIDPERGRAGRRARTARGRGARRVRASRSAKRAMIASQSRPVMCVL